MNKSKLILKMYELLPTALQNNKRIIAIVQPIAEAQLQKTKQDFIRKQWEKTLLEKELKNITMK